MTPKEFWKANNRMFDFCVTSFSQSSFLDFFQTSCWPDFIPWDLCWNQTARQFSDRFAKTAEGVIHCLHVYLQWSRKKRKAQRAISGRRIKLSPEESSSFVCLLLIIYTCLEWSPWFPGPSRTPSSFLVQSLEVHLTFQWVLSQSLLITNFT